MNSKFEYPLSVLFVVYLVHREVDDHEAGDADGLDTDGIVARQVEMIGKIGDEFLVICWALGVCTNRLWLRRRGGHPPSVL